MRRTLALAGFALLAAASARPALAQAIPNITAAKAAATNAANAANAHTAAMSNVEPKAPAVKAPVAKPAQSKPATSQPARPVAKPAATPAKPVATPATPTAAAASAKAPATTAAKPDQKTDGKTSIHPVPVSETGSATNVAKRGVAGEMTFQRETYSYNGTGRRDPFLSLLKSGDLRPLLSDLKLVTVLYDPTGRNSVAIMRDLSTKDQYRVKLGQQIGRMRVVQIQPKQVVFTIEEFGYSRQEALALTDSTTARTR